MGIAEGIVRQSRASGVAVLHSGGGVVRRLQSRVQHARKAPIVLMHGFLGFQSIGPFQYFSGVREALQNQGFHAYTPTVAPVNTYHNRAHTWFYGRLPTADTPAEIDPIHRSRSWIGRPWIGAGSQIPLADIYLRHRQPMHLIGHSQGGIDARLLASTDGFGALRPFDAPGYDDELRAVTIADTIASVTTVSTPHNGLLITGKNADTLLIHVLEHGFLPVLGKAIQILSPGEEATKQVAQEFGRDFMLSSFNPQVRDNPAVRYHSVAGFTNEFQISNLLKPLHDVIRFDPALEAEDNDGLIPVSSARWPVTDKPPRAEHLTLAHYYERNADFRDTHQAWTFLGYIYADHVNQMGLAIAEPINSIFDHLAFYDGLTRFVSGELDDNINLRINGQWLPQQ